MWWKVMGERICQHGWSVTRRRKEAYEALHPETRHGANQHTRVRQNGEEHADLFTIAMSATIGKSERPLQRKAEGRDCGHVGADTHPAAAQRGRSFADQTKKEIGFPISFPYCATRSVACDTRPLWAGLIWRSLGPVQLSPHLIFIDRKA